MLNDPAIKSAPKETTKTMRRRKRKYQKNAQINKQTLKQVQTLQRGGSS